MTMLGEYAFHTYEISGHVWYDPNENGTKSGTAETAMEGITIEVKRTADDSVVATTETNTEGNYSFELLEGEGLYLELTLPDGYKLTRQSESDHTVSANDSDFIRTTNRFNLPTVLRNGTYTNLSAGLVKIPVLTAPDILVMAGETANPTASAQWDYGRATIHYEEALDTTYASVASDGTVSGNQEGTTTATVWVENRLGDRVEETYKITVLSQSVSFTLTKQLTKAAEADETFIFMIQDADSVFYTTLTVAKGSTAASITVEGMAPGSYTVTELDSNWRFKNTGTPSQTQQLSDHNADYSFTFTNEQTTSQWLSGNANVVNKMAPQNP